ncbi:hypothetical protein D3C80_1605900 [compost metagenome]
MRRMYMATPAMTMEATKGTRQPHAMRSASDRLAVMMAAMAVPHRNAAPAVPVITLAAVARRLAGALSTM